VLEDPVDYIGEIQLDDERYDWMAFHMSKKEDQEFPIKTYIDFGLDKLPKEEEKVDPITPMLEVLSNLSPDERLFIQIIGIAHRKKNFKFGNLTSSSTWEKGVVAKINEIMNRDPKTRAPKAKVEAREEDNGYGFIAMLSPGERETIEAMERNAEKAPYETAIRWIYAAKKGKFSGDKINPVIKTFSQYDKIGRNAIGVRWRTDFNYKDLIPGGKRKTLAALKKQELKEYKLRKYFPKSGGDDYKIFTSEELATMFHLPGKVALTPTLERIPSTRAEAPPNLPIGELPS